MNRGVHGQSDYTTGGNDPPRRASAGGTACPPDPVRYVPWRTRIALSSLCPPSSYPLSSNLRGQLNSVADSVAFNKRGLSLALTARAPSPPPPIGCCGRAHRPWWSMLCISTPMFPPPFPFKQLGRAERIYNMSGPQPSPFLHPSLSCSPLSL